MKPDCWMKNIEGNRSLLSLNLPGTHDCVTKYVQLKKLSTTQDLTIKEQLEAGIRALDIRVKSSGERLKMVHGIAKAFNGKKEWMDMEEVLCACYQFLEEHPSEAIVFQFKNDSGKEMKKCFDLLKSEYIAENEEKWFLENRVPSLDEARGKIYLIRRCRMRSCSEYTEKNTGLDFSGWVEQDEPVAENLLLKTFSTDNAEFIIQDRFKFKPAEKWLLCVKPFLDSSSESAEPYRINYLSTAGGIKGPRKNAEYINPLFMEYDLHKGLYYGTLYLDFPSREQIMKIAETNRPLCNIEA